MDPMTGAILAAIVRWLLTIVSQHVNVSDAQTNAIVGGAIAAAPLVWSVIHKVKVNAAIKAATANADTP